MSTATTPEQYIKVANNLQTLNIPSDNQLAVGKIFVGGILDHKTYAEIAALCPSFQNAQDSIQI